MHGSHPSHAEEVSMAEKPMKEFAGLFYREGALEPKTMALVALAAMAAAGCTS
jgi:alkylhydroperoxidase/carboxymuconolactone decarboxylase family protein YurZ